MSITNVLEELNRIKDGLLQNAPETDRQITNPDVLHLLGTVRKSTWENETSEFLAEAVEGLIDISWEECNVGHWSEVPETPKILFAYANFHKVLIRVKKAATCSESQDEFLKEAVAAADLGLMLGKGYEAELTRAASLVAALVGRAHEISSKSSVPSPNPRKNPEERLLHTDPVQSPGKKLWPSDEFIMEKLNVAHLNRSCCPSLEEFSVKHFLPHSPVILTGCMDQWPALKSWADLDYLVRMAGPRTVPVEIGSSYTQKDWGMELTSVQDFIAKHIRGHAHKVGYLAQHQLFDQIPELKRDIIVPDYCCLSEKDDSDCDVNINAWFGPANTLTPLHHDPKHNLLCQVVGSKRIILYSPEDSKFLYPHDESMLNNTAKVDPYDPDCDKYPDFKNASAFYCILKPGEMLYIPPKWWHHVVSLDVSFSVSFWWE